jgi:hypothetical protein
LEVWDLGVASQQPFTLVRLACVDDDAQGQHLQVLWECEVDPEILEAEAWGDLGAKGFDDPRRFAAYVHTLRWNAVTAADPQLVPDGVEGLASRQNPPSTSDQDFLVEARRIELPNLLHAMQALYQLSYAPRCTTHHSGQVQPSRGGTTSVTFDAAPASKRSVRR